MAVMACDFSPSILLFPSATPIASIPGVTTMWPDIPVFPGSQPELENNATLNTYATTMSNINHATEKSVTEVTNFYTDQRMAAQG